MKTLKILIVALLLLLLSTARVHATAGWTEIHDARGNLHRINLTWGPTSSAVSTVTSHVVRWPIDGSIIMVVTDPDASGSSAVSDNYDIYFYSTAHGTTMDVMGGALVNRDQTATEWIHPIISGTSKESVPVWGEITIAITGNSVVGTDGGQIEIFYRTY